MPAFTPQEIHFLFERAFNSGNVEDLVALYEPGAVLVSGGELFTGYEGIRNAYTAFLASGARMKLDTRAVIESGEGLAVLYGAWSLGPPSSTQGLSTEVVRRQPDGSWMFVIDNPHTPL
ncbi:MAG: nuclear transport factor 2 family protein [Bryobacteraceae bacterium]|jgi:ketosteroid isomerase-like protein